MCLIVNTSDNRLVFAYKIAHYVILTPEFSQTILINNTGFNDHACKYSIICNSVGKTNNVTVWERRRRFLLRNLLRLQC